MLVNVDSRLLKTLGLCGGLLVGKMLLMGPITVFMRKKKGMVLSNPEDVKLIGGKIDFNDEDVERSRRAHLNDMENIYLFFSNASFYLLTEPDVGTATILFKTFTAARFLHTICYLGQTPAPSRGIAWVAGHAVQICMAYKTIRHFLGRC